MEKRKSAALLCLALAFAGAAPAFEVAAHLGPVLIDLAEELSIRDREGSAMANATRAAQFHEGLIANEDDPLVRFLAKARVVVAGHSRVAIGLREAAGSALNAIFHAA